jgi:sister-chromatid-cohesion protein PDS5
MDTIARIEDVSPSILEIFSVFIQRISLTLINSEVISELINNIAGSDEYRQISGELLRSISPIFPAIFNDHLSEITALLRDSTFVGASDALQTLAEFAKQFSKSVPADGKAKETLRNFLTSGTVAQATNATIVLSSIANNDAMCRDIAEKCCDQLDVSSPNLLKNLAILSQITLYSPHVFESISGDVVGFIMKKLLLTNTPEQEVSYNYTHMRPLPGKMRLVHDIHTKLRMCTIDTIRCCRGLGRKE